MKVDDRSRIPKAIARGRTWLQELLSGQIAGTEEIAIRERCSERSIRMTLSLAFLSPEVVQAIIAGRLPRGIGMTGLPDASRASRRQFSSGVVVLPALATLRPSTLSGCGEPACATRLAAQWRRALVRPSVGVPCHSRTGMACPP